MTLKKSIAQALNDLSLESDPVVSAIAAALISSVSGSSCDNDISQKEMNERLFALISRQIARSADPAVVARALASIDEYITKQTGHRGPVARRFSPTAAALSAHLEYIWESERHEKQIAENAPIYKRGKNTLCAAPSAPLGPLGAELLTDRILGAVLQQKPTKVHLMLPVQPAPAKDPADIFDALLSDLAEQGVSFEIATVKKTPAPHTQSAKVN